MTRLEDSHTSRQFSDAGTAVDEQRDSRERNPHSIALKKIEGDKTLDPRFIKDAGFHKTKDGSQELFYMRWGTKGGTPFVFFHGGPGDSFYYSHIRLFNPETDDVLFFDQRGCGESRPKASGLSEEEILKTGRPEQIVSDTEELRELIFGSTTVHLVGGSWGTTISLLYAEEHPKQVESMTFWATYLAGHAETDAMFGDRTHDETFPYMDAYNRFMGHVDDRFKEDGVTVDPHKVAAFYLRMVNSPERDTAYYYACEFYRWEITLCSPESPEAFNTIYNRTTEDVDQTISAARIELLYHKHHTMLPDGEILSKVDRIRHIPCNIVQGDQDYCTPMEYAKQLQKQYGDKCDVDEVKGGHIRDDEHVKAAIRSNLEKARAMHRAQQN